MANDRDVTLTIRAKDEASKGLKKIGDEALDLQKKLEKAERERLVAANKQRKALSAAASGPPTKDAQKRIDQETRALEKLQNKINVLQDSIKKTEARQQNAIAGQNATRGFSRLAQAETEVHNRRLNELKEWQAANRQRVEADRAAQQRMQEANARVAAQQQQAIRLTEKETLAKRELEKANIAAAKANAAFIGPATPEGFVRGRRSAIRPERAPVEPRAPREPSGGTRGGTGAGRGRSGGTGVDLQRTALDITQRLRGQVLSLATAYVGLYSAIDQVSKAIAEQRTMTTVKSRLGVALDTIDAEKVGAELAYVRSEAERLGQSFVPLAAGYSKFAAAATQSGATMEQTRVVFRSMAEASTVFGLSADDTAGVMKALEQMFSKGKVTAEELRGQLAERLPGAFAVMADSLGVTTAELNKMMEQGQVTSDALVGFALEYQKRFGDQLPAATQNLNAQLGKLGTAGSDARASFMEGFAEPMSEAIKILTERLKDPAIQKSLKEMGVALGQVAVAVAEATPFLIDLAKAFALFQGIKVAAWFLEASAAMQLVTVATAATKGGMLSAVLASEALSGAVTKLIGLAKLLRVALPLAAIGYLAVEAYKAGKELHYMGSESRVAADKAKQLEIQQLNSAKAAQAEKRAQEELNAVLASQHGMRTTLIADAQKMASELGKQAAELQLDQSTAEGKGAQLRVEAAEKIAEAEKEIITLRERQKSINAQQSAAGNDPAKLDQITTDLIATDKAIRDAESNLAAFKVAINQDTESQITELQSAEAEKRTRAAETSAKEQADALSAAKDIEQGLLAQRAEATNDLGLKIQLVNQQYAEQAAAIQNNTALTSAYRNSVLGLLESEKQREIQTLKQADAEAKLDAQREEADKARALVDDLIQQRDDRMAAAHAERENGIVTEQNSVGALEDTYAQFNVSIQEAIDAAIAKYQALADAGDQSATGVIASLQRMKAETVAPLGEMAKAAQGLAVSMTNQFVDGFAAVVTGAKDAKTAFADMAKSMTMELVKVIAKLLIKKALENSGPFGMAVSAALHTGGVVGKSGAGWSRSGVSTAAFVGAPRYHNGGLAGVKPDEVPAILQKGEEVLTRNDPRHILNGGGQSAPSQPVPQDIKIVNQIDSGSVVREGMRSPDGQKEIMNFLRANQQQVRTVLGA